VIRLLIFGSGLLALVYETVWFRLFSLEFGSALLSSTLVIGAFLFGNGFGSIAGTALLRRVEVAPLRLYAGLELGVALYNLAMPWLADGLGAAAFDGGMAARALTIGLLVTIPSAALGMTFPIFIHADRLRRPDDAESASAVYLWNVVGAMVGALTAGTLLVPLLALGHVGWIASGLGVVLALGASGMASAPADAPAPASPPTEASAPAAVGAQHPSAPGGLPVVWILALFLFGLTSIGVEVVGLRMLFLLGGTSSLYFALFLSLFIGITSAGVWLSRRRVLAARRRAVVIGAPLLLAAGVVAMNGIYPVLPYYYVAWLKPTTSVVDYAAVGALFSALLMLLPCLAMGLFLPSALCLLGLDDPTRFTSAGRVYGIYTIGNTTGAVLTGVLLFPWLGMYHTQLGFVAVCGAVALALAWRLDALRRPLPWAGVVVLAAATLLTPRWHDNLTHFGAYAAGELQPGMTPGNYQDRAWAGLRTLWAVEGPMANVAAVEGAGHRMLMINGKSDAGTRYDMPVQVAVGVLPFVYSHAEELDWCVVGLGAGISAAAAHSTGPASTVIVELMQEVVDAAREGFADYNAALFRDDDVDMPVMDAQYFFANTTRRFDVISQEPTNIWIRGAADLFSVEHLRHVRAALEPGGIATAWVHTYGLTDRAFRDVLTTLHSVFPYIEIYEPIPQDLVFIASAEPLRLNADRLEAIYRGRTRAFLDPSGFPSPLSLLARRLYGQEQVSRYVDEHPGRILSQSRPLLEGQVLASYLGDARAMQEAVPAWDSPGTSAFLATALGRPRLDGDGWVEVARAIADNLVVRPPTLTALVDHVMTAWPTEASALLGALQGFEARGLGSVTRAMREHMLTHYADVPAVACERANDLLERRMRQRGLSRDDGERLRQLLVTLGVGEPPGMLDCATF
jgi:spermidine synthase